MDKRVPAQLRRRLRRFRCPLETIANDSAFPSLVDVATPNVAERLLTQDARHRVGLRDSPDSTTPESDLDEGAAVRNHPDE